MNRTMKPEVAAKYALIGIRPGKYNFKNFGEIDLGNISLPKADDLFKRGFPHLKLRQANPEIPAAGSVPDQKVRPINHKAPDKPDEITEEALEKLRKNKPMISKLLSLEWKDLSDQEKKVFFESEEYFLAKKTLLHQVSEIDRQMQSLHANLKAKADDPEADAERGEIMDQLSELEERKLELFALIDTFVMKEPAVNDPASIAKAAAKEALEKQKLIEAHENYIYRGEGALANMPENTPAQKKKKQAKLNEINRRREELVKLGKPYNRQSRKNA